MEGEISLEILNNFVSLDAIREGNSLKLESYEVVEKISSIEKNWFKFHFDFEEI